jgi:hypothetical protein
LHFSHFLVISDMVILCCRHLVFVLWMPSDMVIRNGHQKWSSEMVILLGPIHVIACVWYMIIGLSYSELDYLRGQSHEIFDPRLFSLNCTPGSPDSWTKTVLHIPIPIRGDIRSNSTTKIDFLLYRIARSRLPSVPHSAESTRKFLLEFHIEWHNAESQIILFLKLRAMRHSAVSRLCDMRHRVFRI